MIPLYVLVMGGAVAVAAGGYLVSRALERKRRAALEEFCQVRGFMFEAERPQGELRLADSFEPFTQGRRRKWGYTISGTRNRGPFTAFEYRWVTGSGKNSQTHCISGIVWERENSKFPKFALSPERWYTRLGALFGMQDIDFEESPDFSRAYRLKSPDEGGVRALLTPEIRQFFAAMPDQQVAGGGRFLFWWHTGRLPAAERLDEWLEQGDQVRRRFLKE
jgi:hypothetical protein